MSALCIEARVDGLRADLVMMRAARALAALEEATAVGVAHVERIAEACKDKKGAADFIAELGIERTAQLRERW